MTTKTPTSIKARNACTLRGVAYTKGQTLTGAQLRAIPNLSALLSNGTLEAVPDIHRRSVGRSGRQSTKLHPVMLKAIISGTHGSMGPY
jgi:hypothetical protein